MVNEPKKNFDTSVTLSGLRLDNPVVPASGTFGYGNEYKDFYDINILGSFSFKGTTREPRFGNPTPRIAECGAGMINAVGLQNPGIDAVIREELPRLKTFFRKPVIANISGFSVEEYAYCCERIDRQEQVGLIEVNVSCPNVRHGGMSFGTCPDAAAEVTRAVKAVTTKPVYIKLSPNVTDIVAIARACEEAGADGLCLINTMLGTRIDVQRRKPVIANISGFSVEEYAYCCERIDKEEQVGLIEVNVSCPNVRHGGMSFGTSPEAAAEVTRAVKAVTTKPVYIKLSPNVTDIVAIARACEQAGADGICLINTMLGMRIDVKCRKPIIANVMGGFSGAAIFPVAVRMVYQVARACRIPVMGCGGVETARDVIEMMMAGATAVQVGAANLRNPYACKEIVEALPREMERLGIERLSDIIGIVK